MAAVVRLAACLVARQRTSAERSAFAAGTRPGSEIGMQRIAIEPCGKQYGAPEEEVGLQELSLYRDQLYSVVQGYGGVNKPAEKDCRDACYHGD